MARLVYLPLLVAGCHIVLLSSRLESRWQGSTNTQMVPPSLVPLYPLFFLGSFFRPMCPGGRSLVSACWPLLWASLWGRKGQQLCWGQRLELKE